MKQQSASCPARRWRGPTRARPTLRARLVRYSIALAALVVMANGASWMLVDAPPAASEFVMATSVIGIVAGDTTLANDCQATDPTPQGHAL